MGGRTDKEMSSKSTEILYTNKQKWVKGPSLPCELTLASCVAFPPTANFSCIVIGGIMKDDRWSSNVYALNRKLTEWTNLGKIRTGRSSHITLALS